MTCLQTRVQNSLKTSATNSRNLYYCTLTTDASINMQPKLVNRKEMLKVLAETSRGIGCVTLGNVLLQSTKLTAAIDNLHA